MLYKQDIYNSDEILSQILKSTVKIDGLLHKLGQHGTEEAAQNLVKLTFILCYIYIYICWKKSKFRGFSGSLRNLPHPYVQPRIAKGVDGQKATLIGLHDEIAGFKAEYDADKRLTPESLNYSLMSQPFSFPSTKRIIYYMWAS